MLTWRRLALAVVLLAALTYAGDYLAVRMRMASDRAPFDTMEIQRLLAIRLKSGRYEIMLDDPEIQRCVHALFSPSGLSAMLVSPPATPISKSSLIDVYAVHRSTRPPRYAPDAAYGVLPW